VALWNRQYPTGEDVAWFTVIAIENNPHNIENQSLVLAMHLENLLLCFSCVICWNEIALRASRGHA
jgi:hypothetical protein